MFQLKHYQQATLDALQGYFQACTQLGNPNTAFYSYTLETLGEGMPYREAPGLPGPPYVCVRIPTGGGKTVIASHAVGIAARDLLHADSVVALWLVPSNTIRDQTIQALRERKHPYRQALEEAFGAVTILDVGEALAVQPPTLATSTAVIVSTMQAFRVEDTEGRKVYEASGSLMSHFSTVPATPQTLQALDKREDGSVIPSLANLLCMHRPVVVVDEAHNARTALSFDTLRRFNPSCIIEFTATPNTQDNPSNVLHSVSAAELFAEDMIKLPIRLETQPDWRRLLSEAVKHRNALEHIADLEQQQTGEYLRPVMLLQAEKDYKDKETVTVDVLRECLMQDFLIPVSQIARATGDYRELDGINLADPDYPRYIITVQQLREGWDCPFAYILCTVAEMRSTTAVEQILGRVMRLPNVKRKQNEELNKAYAFATSANFADAANALADSLIQNGFERHEVHEYIERAPRLPDFQGLPFEALAADSTSFAATESPDLEKLPAAIAAKVHYEANTGTVIFKGVMREAEREALKEVFTTEADRTAVDRMYHESQGKVMAPPTGSPAKRGVEFTLPMLAIKQGDFFEVLEQTHIRSLGWQLSKCDALLTPEEFPDEQPGGQVGEIILDDGKIRTRFVDALQQQMRLLAADAGWTDATLIYWLDKMLPNRSDITQQESRVFLTDVVRKLLDERGLPLKRLVGDKYRLRTAVVKRIEEHREAAYSANLDRLFDDPVSQVTVTPSVVFTYDPQRYHYTRPYQGKLMFRKHYYDIVGDLKSDGEEFLCAAHIDMLPQVGCWVRNPEREPNAFWLATSGDRFYPDFVCRLKDGRSLVVEYKGEHLWNKPSEVEKRTVGQVWEKQSDGSCLFVMVTKKQFSAIDAKLN